MESMAEWKNPAESIEPSRLREFYASHNVDVDKILSEATDDGVRFVRLNPRFDRDESLKLLKSELPDHCPYPAKVDWVDPSFYSMDFYALPATFRMAKSPSFQSGRIYGQDISSGAAVAALLSNDFDRDDDRTSALQSTAGKRDGASSDFSFRILDMCCCPGLKLSAIVDWVHDNQEHSNPSVVVGVDISESRMALCKRIVHKYHIDPETRGSMNGNASVRIRLYRNDGTTFGLDEQEDTCLVFDSEVAKEDAASAREGKKRKRMNKSARARERKRLKQLSDVDKIPKVAKDGNTSVSKARPRNTLQQFDRVLVDAECSTDGSLKHFLKRLAKQNDAAGMLDDDLFPKLTKNDELSALIRLQRGLAATGFRLLKRGGFMVYATCSLSKQQNEEVVSWLLEQNPDARVVPVDFFASTTVSSKLVQGGGIPGTVRFLPNTGGSKEKEPSPANSSLFGGGFFIAKICKDIAN